MIKNEGMVFTLLQFWGLLILEKIYWLLFVDAGVILELFVDPDLICSESVSWLQVIDVVGQ